jgi:microcystin degradation protein MlrC
MPLWGNNHAQANNAPKERYVTATSNASGVQLYANTTLSAFIKNQVTTVEGYTAAGAFHSVHAGWALKKSGAGPVLSINIVAGGTGYSNADVVNITGGTANATANVITNGTGVITSYANLASPGVFVNNSTSTLSITTSAGTGANLTFALGGRAGRKSWECLVAMGSMT